MTIKKAYTNGFQLAIRSPRMIFTLYFTNFLLFALFALSFYSALQTAIGQSMLFDNFLRTDNSLALSDIINNKGQGILAIIAQLKWGILAYWLINVFLVGGVIRTFNKQRYNLNMFFGGAGYNFPRFLGLSFMIILSHILVIGLISFATVIGIKHYSAIFTSEKMYVLAIAFAALIYLLFAIILFMASDFGKFYLLLNDSKNFAKAYFKGIGFVFSKFFKVYVLYLSLLIIPVIFFYLFTKINGDIGMKTISGLAIMFILQQLFVYIRFGFRVWILGSLFEFYSDDFLLTNKIALEKERLSELAEQKAELSKMMVEENSEENNEELDPEIEPSLEFEDKKISGNKDNEDESVG